MFLTNDSHHVVVEDLVGTAAFCHTTGAAWHPKFDHVMFCCLVRGVSARAVFPERRAGEPWEREVSTIRTGAPCRSRDSTRKP
jgi:hypothetical protein